MTTPDLEDVLVGTLHRRAEDAMIHTDTRREHALFEERLAQEEAPRRRRTVVGGSLLAAAATVVAVWAYGDVSDRGPVDPVEPSTEQTPAEEVGDAFFAAIASGDAALAATYVDRDEVPWDDYVREVRRDAAWHVRYLRDPCQELSTSPAGSEVVCPFTYYSLGSDELGLAPFENNTLRLRVSDGQVVHAQPIYNGGGNGEDDLYRGLGAWVRDNHPGDWPFMDDPDALSGPDRARWFRLWDRRIDEFVADRTG